MHPAAPPPPWAKLLMFSHWLTLLLATLASWLFLIPGIPLPQDLHTCYSLYLDVLPPNVCMTHSLPYLLQVFAQISTLTQWFNWPSLKIILTIPVFPALLFSPSPADFFFFIFCIALIIFQHIVYFTFSLSMRTWASGKQKVMSVLFVNGSRDFAFMRVSLF